MDIIVGKTSGFCFGVKNAVEKTLEELTKQRNIYCLGELIHNKNVIKELEEKGLIIVNTIEEVPANEKCIIRAHGITKKEYEIAREKGIILVDLTCPKVVLIHKKVEKYNKEGYTIILYGKRKHPETIGNASFAENDCYIIETKDDLEKTLKEIKNKKTKKIAIISQTTFGVKEFKEYTNIVKETIENAQIVVDNTICNSTELRQKEAEEISKKVDVMVVIGGKHSSNTKELYEVAKRYAPKTIHIEQASELDENIKENNKIGIIAGASTPDSAINEVIEMLQ